MMDDHDETAPAVTEPMARLLRLARDAQVVQPTDCQPRTFRAACRARWLAPREKGYILTSAGRAALAHYHAHNGLRACWLAESPPPDIWTESDVSSEP